MRHLPLAGRPDMVVVARELLRRYQRVRPPLVPITVIVLLVGIAVAAPLLSPHNPTAGNMAVSMRPPFWMDGGDSGFLLGTDIFGRDMLSRLAYGTRISLTVSLVVVLLGGGLGVLLGMIAGYYGGWLDAALMRFVDLVLAFPLILVAIVLAVTFGPSYVNVIIVISALIWPRVARQIRGETVSLRIRDFVTYAEIAGVRTRTILFRHVFPNVLPTLIVLVTLEIGAIILVEASLSFLGAGIPPPAPSWGTMVAEGQGRLATGWWLTMLPGAMILLTVMAFNALGDWLRDYLDPRVRDA